MNHLLPAFPKEAMDPGALDHHGVAFFAFSSFLEIWLSYSIVRFEVYNLLTDTRTDCKVIATLAFVNTSSKCLSLTHHAMVLGR